MLHVDEADSIVSNVINIHWHFFFSSDIRPICNQTFMASFLRFTINFVTFSFQGEHKITSHWMNRLCEYDSIIKRKKAEISKVSSFITNSWSASVVIKCLYERKIDLTLGLNENFQQLNLCYRFVLSKFRHCYLVILTIS